MPYQCRRSAFTADQYTNDSQYFCAIPSAWGKLSEPTQLAKLYKAGGFGALAIYPILGQYAHAGFAGSVRLSKQIIARLSGCDVQTVTRGAQGLVELGLVTVSQGWYRGQPITQWNVQPAMAAPLASERLSPEYFYFPGRFLHGGNWAQLTLVQQAVFLAVATNSFSLRKTPDESLWFRDRLRYRDGIEDLQACYQFNRNSSSADSFLRVSELSYRQLATITGISQSAIKAAVKKLKHPSLWPGVRNDPTSLRYSPLAVYPSEWGSLVYHIRDHVSHWPWDVLNQRDTVIMEDEDDDFPF